MKATERTNIKAALSDIMGESSYPSQIQDLSQAGKAFSGPKTTDAEMERLRRLPKKTTSVSFRVPAGERERLERIFAADGLTFAEAVRRAVYAYARELEGKAK